MTAWLEDPCEHLWRIIFLNDRPIGVSCEGPCGASLSIADPETANEPPIIQAQIGVPLRLDLGVGGGPTIMTLENVQSNRQLNGNTETVATFVNVTAKIRDVKFYPSDMNMTIREDAVRQAADAVLRNKYK